MRWCRWSSIREAGRPGARPGHRTAVHRGPQEGGGAHQPQRRPAPARDEEGFRHGQSPPDRFGAVAGMRALLKGQTRRLARFGEAIRAATGMVLGGAGVCPALHPPHPPTMENRPRRGQAARPRGSAIGFFYCGGRRVCQKHGEIVVTHRLGPVAVRPPRPRVGLKYPRVAVFYPRVGLFYPRVVFLAFAPAPVSISLFSLVRERRERLSAGRQAIHGFFRCLKKHPRVCYKFGSYSVDEIFIPGTLTPYKSITYALSTEIPRSTGKNAYTPHGGGSQ